MLETQKLHFYIIIKEKNMKLEKIVTSINISVSERTMFLENSPNLHWNLAKSKKKIRDLIKLQSNCLKSSAILWKPFEVS